MAGYAIYSHNIEDRIFDQDMQDVVLAQDAGVVFLIEGYSASADEVRLKETIERAFGNEYHWWIVPYEDEDGRGDTHGYIVLVRTELEAYVDVLRAGGRNFPLVVTPERTILCVHLDDRTIERRTLQIQELFGLLDAQHDRRPVMVGDFNSDHHDGLLGRALNFWPISFLISMVSRLEIDPDVLRQFPESTSFLQKVRRKVGRLVSLARRLRDMTSPDNPVLGYLTTVGGYVDADEKHRMTRPLMMKTGVKLGAQLDHLLYDESATIVDEFTIVRSGPSDHWGIRAIVE